MGFLSDVFSLQGGRYPVTNRSRVGHLALLQGAIYIIIGLTAEFYPKLWSLAMLSDEKSAMEGWFRGWGFTIFYLGIFYLFAGIADNKQFAAQSVVMRCIFVPLLMGFLGGNGYIPPLVAGIFGSAIPAFSIIPFVVYHNHHKSVDDTHKPANFLLDALSLEGGHYPVTNRSWLGWWSIFQGANYTMIALTILFYPKLWSLVKLSDEESAMEGWFRGTAFTDFYIGLFFLGGGIADNKQFAIQSVFMRCIFMPILFMGFLGGNGYIPPLVAGFFGLADPGLAIITYVVYQKSVADAYDKVGEVRLAEQEV